MTRILLAAAVAAAGVAAGAAPAAAAATCAGTTNTIVVCADPTGTTLYSDCIHAGGGPCTPVSVPGPTVWCTPGPLLSALGEPPVTTVDLRDVDCYVL